MANVSERSGVSAHSLYRWVRSVKPDNGHQAHDLPDAMTEILRLKAQLKRTRKEQDVHKKAARYFAREPD
jgi:transposase